MNEWRIEFSQEARKFLHKLRDEKLKRRIGRAIDALMENPRQPGGKAMSGLENTWRIRVGDYRVIYEIQDDRLIIQVIRVGHRGDVYR